MRISTNQAKWEMSSTATTSSASRPNSESMGRRIGLAIRHEDIAASAHGLHEARRRRIGFQDSAQTPDLDVDAAVRAVVLGPVQELQQPLARERTHRMVNEDFEQRELTARQRQRAAVHRQR